MYIIHIHVCIRPPARVYRVYTRPLLALQPAPPSVSRQTNFFFLHKTNKNVVLEKAFSFPIDLGRPDQRDRTGGSNPRPLPRPAPPPRAPVYTAPQGHLGPPISLADKVYMYVYTVYAVRRRVCNNPVRRVILRASSAPIHYTTNTRSITRAAHARC